MNHQIPSVEDFLAHPDPDDDLDETGPTFGGYVGVIQGLPPEAERHFPPTDLTGYVREISASLKAIVEATLIGPERVGRVVSKGVKTVAYDDVSITQPIEAWEADRLHGEALADAEAKLETLTQVISDVEAALGKSKAAPALAAKAVIYAWRNPQVPAAENQDEVDVALEAGEIEQPDAADGTLAKLEADGHLPGHTRTPHPEGPDFCRECSGELQEWVGWPCPTITQAFNPLGAPVETTGPDDSAAVQQPERNAPVEEWREYARALGFAGPDIDKANRSVIRTTLGIAQTEGE